MALISWCRLLLLAAVMALLPTQGTGTEGVCAQTEDGIVCEEEEYKLTRLDGVKVGHEQQVELQDRTLTLKTLSFKPLLFEIPGFLSDVECDHFISLAEKEGLQSSQTTSVKGDVPHQLNVMDINGDKQLTLDEMRLTIENGFDIYPDNEDVLQLYTDMKLDENEDGFISPKELGKVTVADLKVYLSNLIDISPEKHSRYSNQVWLYPDRSTDLIFKHVQNRVSRVTKLPKELVRMSDFQVVQYEEKGHYNAHYDSSTLSPRVPCCKRFDKRKCRICRFMTILFYLNDVEDGGETAFLVADNKTFDYTVVRQNNHVNLYRRCDDANLQVKPERGKAVMWYNHFVSEDSQWLGEQDDYGLHGGCPVIAGKKWIANFWIKVTDNKEEDAKTMSKLKYSSE